jgi:hypothetical protein
MIIDRYTKGVLTVIAVALATIAVQQIVPTARALGDCGQSRSSPCFIEVVGRVPVY